VSGTGCTWVAPIAGAVTPRSSTHAFLLISPDEPPVKEEQLDRGRRR
jgi:hypothetical protein